MHHSDTTASIARGQSPAPDPHDLAEARYRAVLHGRRDLARRPEPIDLAMSIGGGR